MAREVLCVKLMTKLSANLGFLWQELTLLEGIKRAKEAGFQAVECHWPYHIPADELKSALQAAGLPMLGLNTQRGDVAAGEAGLTAVPGRQQQARDYIDQAIEYGAAIGCTVVHVMSGVASGPDARNTLLENLEYAAEKAAVHSIDIVIEPINSRDMPGYFLTTIEQAAQLIHELQRDSVKIMFDCYHVQIMQGDLLSRLQAHLPLIGHIQIAAVPDRGEPGQGEIDYVSVCAAIDAMGWQGYVGAEYRPRSTTDEGLGWMASIR